MNRLLLYAIPILMAYGIASSGLSQYGEDKGIEFSPECNQVESIGVDGGVDFYYIYVFKRLVPIPTRFVLLTQNKSSIYFSSQSQGISGLNQLMGSISIHEYSPEVINEYKVKADNVSEFNYKGLTVIALSRKGYSEREVILHDGKQFISIIDDNEFLWKTMIDGMEK